MSVIALGLDHTTAPLDVRGRFAFPRESLVPTLQRFRDQLRRSAEVAIVSTCNRTELFLGSETDESDALTTQAMNWLADSGGMPVRALHQHFYVHNDASAARHTFRLASGMASMVVGETQILGQLKHAVREADTAGTLGTTLHQLFQRSFAVAKEVRAGTEIGMHSISLAAAIVRLAEKLFEEFGQLNVLFIGAGDMAGPVLAHIAGRSPLRLTVANRSIERGEGLARQHGADAIGLTEALSRLPEFDLVISCTGSPVPLIGLGAVERAVKARRRRPILMVDLAVPRDIESEVGKLDDVYLHTIDDLARIVQVASGKRQAAMGQAESIIESGVLEFQRWLDTRESVPMIQALQLQAESWRTAELQRARKLLAKGEDVNAVLEALSRGLTQKMLHGPMAGLQNAGGEGRSVLIRTLSQLFLQCPVRNRRDG